MMDDPACAARAPFTLQFGLIRIASGPCAPSDRSYILVKKCLGHWQTMHFIHARIHGRDGDQATQRIILDAEETWMWHLRKIRALTGLRP